MFNTTGATVALLKSSGFTVIIMFNTTCLITCRHYLPIAQVIRGGSQMNKPQIHLHGGAMSCDLDMYRCVIHVIVCILISWRIDSNFVDSLNYM